MKRLIFALVLGILGSIVVWVAAPLNLQMLNNGLISDSYLPEVAVMVITFLVVIVNPVLKKLSANRLFISTRQFALIFIMLLMACTIPTQGLLRAFPYTLSKVTQKANQNLQLAEEYQKMDLPPSLFPDEIGFGKPSPNANYFLDELPDGASIPWGAWVPPLLSWGALFAAVWMLMIGLGMIVYPQWRENERLPFPILEVEQSLIGPITAENKLPPIFKDKLFWVGCGFVLFIYLLNGLSATTHGKWPAFPLGWNLSGAFSEEPWRHLPHRTKQVSKVYFALIGLAFFMPKRISFSIWFTMIAYSVYQMLGTSYAPPFNTGMIVNVKHGANLAIGLMVIFTGRQYWAKVCRNMFKRNGDPEEKRNKIAGWVFVSGWIGMMAWLIWAGLGPVWAFATVFICFISALVISRIIAETGMPFIRLDSIQASWLAGLFPTGLVSATLFYLTGFLNIIFTQGSRISGAAMMTHAMGMDKEMTPKQQSRLPALLLPLMLLGLVVAGSVHLKFGYENYASLDTRRMTSTGWAAAQMGGSENKILALSRQAHNPIGPTSMGHTLMGGLLALGLAIGCLSSPAWPLHPVGLLMVNSFYARVGWASVMLGWAAKMLILRYGGATTYKRLRTLFIGIIIGEVLAAVIWALVPVILILNGADPSQIGTLRVVPS